MVVKRIKKELPGITMNKEVLLKALKTTLSAVDKSGHTGVEQAQDFILRGDRIIAYNDNIAISTPLEFDTELDLTIRATDFCRVLQSIKDDVVSLDMGETDELIVTSASTTAYLVASGLGGVLEDLLAGMGLDNLRPSYWQELPSDFLDGLVLCSFAASAKKENMAYHAIYMNGLDMWATDDYRISNYKVSKKTELYVEEILMPLGAVKELCKQNPTHLQQVGTWLHFKDADGLLFSMRLHSMKYPDCAQFMKVKGTSISLPVSLADALQAVLVFVPGEDKHNQEAELSFKKGRLVCTAENERGKIIRHVPVDADDLECLKDLPTININPLFFIDVLQRSTTLTLDKDGNKALFASKRFKHVMSLSLVDQQEDG